MAASQTKPRSSERKQPAREGSPNLEKHFRFPHDWRWILPAIADNSAALMSLLLGIVSRANQRSADGSINGWTWVTTTKELADEAGVDIRSIQMLLEDATDPEMEVYPLALLEQKTIIAAIKEGLLPKGTKVVQGGYIFRPLVANWELIAREMRRRRAEEDAGDEDDTSLDDLDEDEDETTPESEDDTPAPVPREPLRLYATEPVIIKGISEPRPLTPAARVALARVTHVQPEVEFPEPVSFDSVVQDGVLRCIVKLASSAGTGEKRTEGEVGRNAVRDRLLNPHGLQNGNAGETGKQSPHGSRHVGQIDALATGLSTLDPPILLRSKLREEVRAALDVAPVSLLLAAIKKRRDELKARGETMGDGLVKHLATEVKEHWILHADKAFEKYAAAPAAPAKAEGYFERRARELAEQRSNGNG